MSDDLSWNDLLESLITEDDSKTRKKLAKKLRKWIESKLESAETPKENGHMKNESTKAVDDSNGKVADENESEKPTKSTKNKEKSDKIKEEAVEKKKKWSKSEDASTASTPAPSKKQKVEEEEEEESVEHYSNGNDQSKSAEKKRFQRVDEEKALQIAIVADNRYEAVFGSGGYGAKANEKLKTVRGKDFRHEKTKKKRGSYRGGAIDEGAICSVDFDSD